MVAPMLQVCEIWALLVLIIPLIKLETKAESTDVVIV